MAVPVLALLGTGWFFGQALWLEGKAMLAQRLIAGAWAQTLTGREDVRPWPWADTWPVARLIVPQGDDLYVLDGVHGQALAFGPGHLSASRSPGEAGPTIIAGHRDTHFAFLRRVQLGDVIGVQDRTGEVHRYRVAEMRVMDSRAERLSDTAGTERLVLVTCYPFEALSPGGPLRYVVTAVPIHDTREEDGRVSSVD